MQQRITCILVVLAALSMTAVSGKPYFDGTPQYRDAAARAVAEKMLEAHGGMAPFRGAKSLEFRFFTKVVNAPRPFYSYESIDLENGAAYIDWELFDAQVGWDTKTVWSINWQVPLPPGFFIHLTAGFITLPWQIQSDDALIGPVSEGVLPDEEGLFDVLRVQYPTQNPSLPGTFYELFIDRESGLLRGVRFDINHPGMVANPNQPLGPNVHVFSEYRRVDGLVVPTFYKSWGQNSAKGGKSNAYHFVWDIRTDQPFDNKRLIPPPNAVLDSVSMKWWGTPNSAFEQGDEQ